MTRMPNSSVSISSWNIRQVTRTSEAPDRSVNRGREAIH